MDINTFLQQRLSTQYSFAQHVNALTQFDFFLKEFNFSEKELLQTIHQFSNSENYNFHIKEFFSHPSPTNLFKSTTPNSNIIKNECLNAKTHLALEAIRAVRDSFNSIYPVNKINKNTSPENLIKIQENIQNIIKPFFSIMNQLPIEKMENISTIANNAFFGKNISCNYHEALVLLSTHNFTKFHQQEFIDIIDKVIPDNSLDNTVFLGALAGILYDEEKTPLMKTIFRKTNQKLFNFACFSQNTNHRNFYYALKNFLQDTEGHIQKCPFNNPAEYIMKLLRYNFANTGMLNNAYYNKLITKEDKNKFANFLNSYNLTNETLTNLLSTLRSQNIDFEAFVNTPNISDVNIICHILLKTKTEDKGNIAALYNFIAPYDKINLNELGKKLGSMNHSNMLHCAHLFSERATKEQVLQLMSSHTKLFEILSPIYRGMKLHTMMGEKEVEKNFSKPKI